MSNPIERIRARCADVERQREQRQGQAASFTAAGLMIAALHAEKDAAQSQGQVHGLMFALDVLRMAESEAAEPTHAALLDLAETVALGNTDPDDLAAMAERLLGQVPEGCTGYRDRQGHMAHDDATCPIHEGAES